MSVTNENENDILNRIRIAAPCSARWEAMPGGERVRSCGQCNHKVYNISEMTAAEAASLIQNSEGRVCVRLYRRADGSVMTRDCPTGVRAARQRVARAATAAFASAATVFGGVSYLARSHSHTVTETPSPTMGEVMYTPATPQPTASPEPEMPVVMGTPAPLEDPTTYATMGKVVMQKATTPLPMVDTWGTPAPKTEKEYLPSDVDSVKSDDAPARDPFTPLVTEKHTGRR